MGSPTGSFSADAMRLPGGDTTLTPEWLSMKHPDMLSASERVLHHNLANVAIRLDQVQRAFQLSGILREAGKFPLSLSPTSAAMYWRA